MGRGRDASSFATSPGGLRIVNNRFNQGAGQSCIGFVGTVVSPNAMSPIIIANNSIEGCLFGIFFQRVGAATVFVGNLVIAGNEIAASGNNCVGISIQQGGGNAFQWVNGGVISGNYITGNNGTGIGLISLNTCTDFTIAGNQFTSNSPGTTAIVQRGNTARITIPTSGNGKGVNVT
jgi:hypothetical protein